MDAKWLLVCPQLPATPSSPRVMVWRRLRSAGALGLDNGLWVLPSSPTSPAAAQEIAAYIEAQGGNCKLFWATSFDEKTEARILDGFRHDRSEEYFEVKEQCLDFLAEIEKETHNRNFSFAEYEENEQNLVKLEVWFEKVKARDFLGGEQAQEATDLIENCRQALQQFATDVYIHVGVSPLSPEEKL